MIPSAENEDQKLQDAIASCSTETKRLITKDVLALPAIRHMLLVFLKDTSRSSDRIDHNILLLYPKARSVSKGDDGYSGFLTLKIICLTRN